MSTSIPLSGQHHEGDHPELENHAQEPKGVTRRNLKMQVYLGIAVLFIIATAISSLRHKPAAKQQGQSPVPMVQDSNANIECDGPEDSKKTLLVYGFVRYRDVFGPDRETRFAYTVRGLQLLRLPGTQDYWEYSKYT